MADIRYNVSELFQLAFGVQYPFFLTEPIAQDQASAISFSGIKTLANDGFSWMNTPIMFNATFVAGSYKLYKRNGEITTKSLESLTLPAATMFTFRRAKNITRTNVLGSNGTVKEIYGFDDWVIDVKGVCVDERGNSAQDQFARMLEWENLADSIEISGTQFKARELSRVVMSEWSENIPQGKPGVVAFSTTLYGDEPMEFGLPSAKEIRL